MQINLDLNSTHFIWEPWSSNKKMQLDVEVGPPANIITFRLGLTLLTFDLDPWSLTLKTTCKTAKCDLKSHFWLWPWLSTLTHVTFDLDPRDPWPQKLPVRWSNETWNNVFFDLVTLTFDLDPQGQPYGHPRQFSDKISWPYVKYFWRYEFWSSNFWSSEFWSSHRHQTDIQNAIHVSPPCICTGGLKIYQSCQASKSYGLPLIVHQFIIDSDPCVLCNAFRDTEADVFKILLRTRTTNDETKQGHFLLYFIQHIGFGCVPIY